MSEHGERDQDVLPAFSNPAYYHAVYGRQGVPANLIDEWANLRASMGIGGGPGMTLAQLERYKQLFPTFNKGKTYAQAQAETSGSGLGSFLGGMPTIPKLAFMAIGGAAAAGAGAGAAANTAGLVQMGQAAGLSGAALESFVASGGTMGSLAAGGGGIGI